jgi:hypothetical protein
MPGGLNRQSLRSNPAVLQPVISGSHRELYLARAGKARGRGARGEPTRYVAGNKEARMLVRAKVEKVRKAVMTGSSTHR